MCVLRSFTCIFLVDNPLLKSCTFVPAGLTNPLANYFDIMHAYSGMSVSRGVVPGCGLSTSWRTYLGRF